LPEHRRRLTWRDRALKELEDLADVMPAAALTAVEAMERMASTGFNYGRATSEPGVWYFPTGKIGIYYADDGTTLTVQAAVDARRLRELPY
jgi:hypothetical protein